MQVLWTQVVATCGHLEDGQTVQNPVAMVSAYLLSNYGELRSK